MQKNTQAYLSNEIRLEYRKLLSIGKADREAENLIISHYSKSSSTNACADYLFWLTFAEVQWEMGRLSPYVREQASKSLDVAGKEAFAQEIAKKISSPELERKKVARPRVRKCPYKPGDILAYQIRSCEELEGIRGSAYWGKYVLLRVVSIRHWPFSHLAPEDCWDESMIVALFDWYGDEIPHDMILSQLDYTPIKKTSPSITPGLFSSVSSTMLKDHLELSGQLSKVVTTEHVTFCVDLDWAQPNKKYPVISLIAEDAAFTDQMHSFFDTSVIECPMCGVHSFDIVLVKRLEQLYGKNM